MMIQRLTQENLRARVVPKQVAIWSRKHACDVEVKPPASYYFHDALNPHISNSPGQILRVQLAFLPT